MRKPCSEAERVGTDDPAALLPYLEHTPDALEHYLAPGSDFEAEFNRTLKESFSWELFQIFGFVGYDFTTASAADTVRGSARAHCKQC